MRIGDVEKVTGLSRKTIRFYETRGLLSVERSENSCRDYNADVVEQLKEITTLRKAGVGLSDIQLWQDQVISYEEMLRKRLYELRDEPDAALEQIELCHSLMEDGLTQTVRSRFRDAFDESVSDSDFRGEGALCVGIDIGTTTISAAVLNPDTGRSVTVYTIQSNAFLKSPNFWEKIQDAGKILNRVQKLLDSLIRRFSGIISIGFSGQMHGILYLNENGQALSPLYTWQDERAGLGKPSACEEIFEKTGYRVSPGYGLATHFYQQKHGLVPEGTACLCTVMDYVAASVCGTAKPVMHISNAASLGLYSMEKRDFDREALLTVGISPALLPRVTDSFEVIGHYRGIPVTAAIGDNQASFLGAVSSPGTMALANIGTGSQISVMLPDREAFIPEDAVIECRPCSREQKLICGSALCGGRAYAVLERFFRDYIAAAGLSVKEQYEILNRLAESGLQNGGALEVDTAFCGTRNDPKTLGSVCGISENNLTPENLAAGVVMGMARELYGMFRRMPHEPIRTLVVSGNAVRKNKALRIALKMVFGMELLVPESMEEAAYGAALVSAVSLGDGYTMEKMCAGIRYLTHETD